MFEEKPTVYINYIRFACNSGHLWNSKFGWTIPLMYLATFSRHTSIKLMQFHAVWYL